MATEILGVANQKQKPITDFLKLYYTSVLYNLESNLESANKEGRGL